MTISVSQFPALAAGCVLYLSSPGLVCTAASQGRWGEETEHFLHNITHLDEHEHRHEEGEAHQDHEHEHIGIHGLKVVLQKLHDHYEPSNIEVSTRLQQTIVVLFKRYIGGVTWWTRWQRRKRKHYCYTKTFIFSALFSNLFFFPVKYWSFTSLKLNYLRRKHYCLVKLLVTGLSWSVTLFGCKSKKVYAAWKTGPMVDFLVTREPVYDPPRSLT